MDGTPRMKSRLDCVTSYSASIIQWIYQSLQGFQRISIRSILIT